MRYNIRLVCPNLKQSALHWAPLLGTLCREISTNIPGCSTIPVGFNLIRNLRILSPTKEDPKCRFVVQNHSVWPNFAKVTTIIGKNVAIFLNSSSGSCIIE